MTDELGRLRDEFEEILNDGRDRTKLQELVDKDCLYVGRRGKYMIMMDCYGESRDYDPDTDTVLQLSERRKMYDE